MMTKISERGLAALEASEGTVLNTYRCPAGVLTIGNGFTSRSAAVRKYLGYITPGMTITREECRTILRAVVDEEFGVAVNKKMPDAKQHQHDAGCSISYNVGTRVLGWKWAQAFRAGKISLAARLMRKTACTANGKLLPGLVRRRKEEANMLEFARYPVEAVRGVNSTGQISIDTNFEGDTVGIPHGSDAGGSVHTGREILEEYQEKLQKLGYYSGDIDGLKGPATRKAVLDFQKADPHLTDDGIMGRATRESIDRKFTERSSARGGVGVGVLSTAGTVMQFISGVPEYVQYGLYGLAGLILLWLIWRYRSLMEAKALEILRV